MSRTVVVTGGGTGIGRAVAIRFAKDGHAVVITGRRPEPLEETVRHAGDSVRAVVCDVTDPTQLHALLDELPQRIDVLVNNAGGNRGFDSAPPKSLDEIATSWRENFEANVITAVLTTEALTSRLADGGAVISIGSIAADKGAGTYGAAKSALATWNLTIAGQLGPRGITCNVIAPGLIVETEFFRDQLSDERRQTLVGDTLTGRPGEPADIAGTAAFLASPDARHITGQVIHVNGGARTTR